MKSALILETIATCSTTKARVNKLQLPHGLVDTPVFMPVGTQGTLKGFLPKELEAMNCQIMLNNTYHLVRRDLFINFFFNKKRGSCVFNMRFIGIETWSRNTGSSRWVSFISKLERQFVDCK